jgi:hypothetical protein
MFQRQQSIRQGYLTKLRALLGNDVAKEFDELYQRRSAFVHYGKHRGSLQPSANRARAIAQKVLTKELESA